MTRAGDGIDRGVRTGEQFQHFVYWAVMRHDRENFSDEEVMNILRTEFPHRKNKKKWPNQKPRTFQKIALHRTYAKRGKLGIHDGREARQLLARIDGKMNDSSTIEEFRIPEEVDPEIMYPEGSVHKILVNRYERDPDARARCIREYGYRCVCCDQTLEEIYGPVAKRVIHVHHEQMLSELGSRETDPVRDLKPVCPNCHAIIHAKVGKPMSIRHLQKILKKGKT